MYITYIICIYYVYKFAYSRHILTGFHGALRALRPPPYSWMWRGSTAWCPTRCGAMDVQVLQVLL